MQFEVDVKRFTSPELMAESYLSQYYRNQGIQYPINPFQMLKDEGILFSLMDFKRLEGVYIPSSSLDDIPVVGININRPITRQRFTAAHELCHHLRDSDKQISCPIARGNNPIEKFAENFAAALLMPINELRHQVNMRKKEDGKVEFDDILKIADFFGVSFESCVYRIAYRVHAVSGNIDPEALRSRIKEYGPDKVRKEQHMTYAALYSGLIDCYQEQLSFQPSDYARFLFQNEYIYNDSRMEGLDVTLEQASEIVTDLRMNQQNSEYCNEGNDAYMSIAGHYDMYREIFEIPVKDVLSIYDTFRLNCKLFSHYPHPEFGGMSGRVTHLLSERSLKHRIIMIFLQS